MKASWLVLAALVLPTVAQAHGELPLPVIDSSTPAKIFPGQMTLDVNGQIEVTFHGSNLGPNDGDNGHPAGWEGGYQHIEIRGVSASGVLGAWVDCHSNDCLPRGVTGIYGDALYLGLAPRILSEPGSHLQVRVWVSVSPIETMDPEASTVPSSEWSQPYTLDIASPGDTPPVTVTATVVSGDASSSASSSSAGPVYRSSGLLHPQGLTTQTTSSSSSSSSSSSTTTKTGTVKRLQTHTPGG